MVSKFRTIVEPDGTPSLSFFAEKGNLDEVRSLADMFGADPNSRGRNGRTSLHVAAKRAAKTGPNGVEREILRTLLRAGADPRLPDDEGITPYQVANERTRALLDANADVAEQYLSI